MRVLVTGATGFIGSAVVQDLLSRGHDVLGLARSDASASLLEGLGVEVHRGELNDLESLAAGVRAVDGVIHTAFIHDFAHYEANAETDERALAAMASAMAGTDKPLIVTSGLAVLEPGRVGVETDEPVTEGLGRIRARSEVVLSAKDKGIRVNVVRLPPTVHGRGDRAFIPALIDMARRTGVSAYFEDGTNRWSAVHRLDAARLFVRALEAGRAGSRYHGVAEGDIAFRSIAEAIGDGLGLPVRPMPLDEAMRHFDWLAPFAALDMPASSLLTRAQLGWSPQHAGLLADLHDGGYFEKPT